MSGSQKLNSRTTVEVLITIELSPPVAMEGGLVVELNSPSAVRTVH